MSDNIFLEANDIINNRGEEKERMYGPMIEGMEKTAQLLTIITQKEFTAKDVYLTQIAIKLTRESYNKKYDNLLDAVSYMGAMYNHYKKDYDKTK